MYGIQAWNKTMPSPTIPVLARLRYVSGFHRESVFKFACKLSQPAFKPGGITFDLIPPFLNQ